MVHHLPEYIQKYGPVWTHWMFVFERYNHVLMENISNKKQPELSAIKRMEVTNINMFQHTYIIIITMRVGGQFGMLVHHVHV